MRSIEHTWLCAISHIFHVTGSDVKLVSDFTGTVAFGEMLRCRRMQFLDGLRYVDNPVLQFCVSCSLECVFCGFFCFYCALCTFCLLSVICCHMLTVQPPPELPATRTAWTKFFLPKPIMTIISGPGHITSPFPAP